MGDVSLVDELVNFYGTGSLYPSREQWQLVANNSHDGSVTIVNFIQLRESADYDDGTTATGLEALLRYSEISQKTVAKVGGEFIAQGLYGGVLIGDSEQWDSIGIVRYPSIKAFIDVFRDPDYRLAHHHRAAGTLHHKMVLLLDITF
jgi:uncharacterized protein (DUF1330 family)